jgi:hypothetical protein
MNAEQRKRNKAAKGGGAAADERGTENTNADLTDYADFADLKRKIKELSLDWKCQNSLLFSNASRELKNASGHGGGAATESRGAEESNTDLTDYADFADLKRKIKESKSWWNWLNSVLLRNTTHRKARTMHTPLRRHTSIRCADKPDRSQPVRIAPVVFRPTSLLWPSLSLYSLA